MLSDLLENLINAKTDKDKERAYHALERVGVDRRTADVLAAEISKGEK